MVYSRLPQRPVSAGFSECGKYVVTKGHGSHVHVISIPTALLSQAVEQISKSIDDKNALQVEGMQEHRGGRIEVTAQNGALAGPRTNLNARLSQSWEVDIGGNAVGTQVSVTNGEVLLSIKSKTAEQTADLVTLPAFTAVEKLVPTVFLPRQAGDSIQISLDEPPQKLYALDKDKSGIMPMLIKRDPAFVDIKGKLPNLEYDGTRSAKLLLETATMGRKRRHSFHN